MWTHQRLLIITTAKILFVVIKHFELKKGSNYEENASSCSCHWAFMKTTGQISNRLGGGLTLNTPL